MVIEINVGGQLQLKVNPSVGKTTQVEVTTEDGHVIVMEITTEDQAGKQTQDNQEVFSVISEG